MPQNPDLTRWLTIDETMTLLRVDFRHLKKMVKKGVLVAIEVNAPTGYPNKRGARKLYKTGKDGWRILFPGDRFIKYTIDQTKRLETTPLLSARETATLLGIADSTLRWHTMKKTIQQTIIDGNSYYSVSAIRDFMAVRSRYAGTAKLHGLGKKQLLAWMIEWGKEMIKERRPDLGEVLDQILSLPDTQRSLRIESLIAAAETFKAMLNMPPEIPGLEDLRKENSDRQTLQKEETLPDRSV